MKKILVIGSGGAGKSTFAGRLGRILNIEVIHLDVLYWNAGWVETPKPKWRKTVEELVKRDSWIIDGNYSGTFDIRFEACDTVIFLDVARPVCLWRVLKRRMVYRHRGRSDMAEGCHEKFNLEFLRWIWGYPKRTRPTVLNLLEKYSQSKAAIYLRTRSEIEECLLRVTKEVPQALYHSHPVETG